MQVRVFVYIRTYCKLQTDGIRIAETARMHLMLQSFYYYIIISHTYSTVFQRAVYASYIDLCRYTKQTLVNIKHYKKNYLLYMSNKYLNIHNYCTSPNNNSYINFVIRCLTLKITFKIIREFCTGVWIVIELLKD